MLNLRKISSLLLAAAAVVGLTASAFAQGLVVERTPDVPPEQIPRARNWGISIKSHLVEVEIKDQVATTKVTEVFHNPTPQQLEATFFFPLPEEAAIKQFAMTMNGKMVEGEVLEASKAREIYEGIVRAKRDPGLLEYVGRKLFRCRIFPVTPNGDTSVVMTYTELLNGENGLVRYFYPMNTTKFTDLNTEQVTVSVKVDNQIPLRSVYSPTHEVDVTRGGDRKATAGFEAKNVMPNSDFLLYYTVNTQDIGVSLVTSKEAGDDGYFMLLITPKTEYTPEEIQPKDIIFVMDVSGSMADDDKITQAKNALKYCLKSLDAKDRFNIVAFSTEARVYKPGELVGASKENIEAAVAHADTLKAAGGTAIDDALQTGLGLVPKDGNRVTMLVFMTDGLPTVGERDINRILGNTRTANTQKVRLFTFGVGNDVNTHLLDKLAEETKGAREYISPKEDIEAKVGAFYGKVASPVLADLKLTMGDVSSYDVFPRQLPDLFKGSQLVVFGRYRGQGAQPIKLVGKVGGADKSFTYEGTFTANDNKADFLARLWALRKVGFMMDEIRLRGANEELRKEIVRLGTKFGIVTPYTSFLAVEEGEIQPATGRPGPAEDGSMMTPRREGGRDLPNAPQGQSNQPGQSGGGSPNSRPAAEPPPMAAPKPNDPAAPADNKADSLANEAHNRQLQSGEKAIERAKELEELKKVMSLDDALSDKSKVQAGQISRKAIANKTFIGRSGWWVDTEYDANIHKDAKRVEVEYMSQAYFDLLKKIAALAKYASAGDRVVIVLDGVAYVIKPAPEVKKDEKPAEK